MTQRINYDKGTNLGAPTARFVNALMLVLADGRRLKGTLDATVYGSDWHTLALALNITDIEAQDLWTLIATAVGQIDTPQVTSLYRLYQG